MSNRSERYKQRKAIMNSFKDKSHIKELSNSEDVKGLLAQKVDFAFIDRALESDRPAYNLEVSEAEVLESLSTLDKHYNKDKYDVLFESSKEILIDQLLSPFKLSRSDVQGVDRNFEYQRTDYISSPKTVGGEGVSFDTQKKRSKHAVTDSGNKIKDVNTGKFHHASEMDYDHKNPLKSMHDNGGFMLSDAEKRQFGADPDNLDFTHNSINRAKGSQDHKEFVDKSNNADLDKRRTNAVHKQGQKAAEKYVPSGKVNKAIFVAKRGAQDGIKTGKDQGLQAAMGSLLSEFISAIFSEVKDILSNGWKNGQYDISWIEAFALRMKNIKNQLLSKWKNVAEAFGSGAMSGLLSAIITAIINMFVRTSKNIVRLIREGFLSLMKAIKTLISPPEGMTLKQAGHEASKVLASGLVLSGGILAGESLATMLNGIPFADTISMVLTGLVSGLGSLFTVYLLDKLDLFGVVESERHEFIIGKLEPRMTLSIERTEAVIERLGISYSDYEQIA